MEITGTSANPNSSSTALATILFSGGNTVPRRTGDNSIFICTIFRATSNRNASGFSLNAQCTAVPDSRAKIVSAILVNEAAMISSAVSLGMRSVHGLQYDDSKLLHLFVFVVYLCYIYCYE